MSSHAVLVGLYEEPEKPGNALEFFQQHLTAEGPATSDIEALKKENGELKARIEEVGCGLVGGTPGADQRQWLKTA
jgi:hypothetical protein